MESTRGTITLLPPPAFITAVRAAKIADLITSLDVLPFFIFFFAAVIIDEIFVLRRLHIPFVLRFRSAPYPSLIIISRRLSL